MSVVGSAQVLAPGAARAVASSVAGSSLLSAPTTYGDRAFLGWEHAGVRFSTSPTLSALPESLSDGDTVTAVYGPLSPQPSSLAPSYNQPNYGVWTADKLPLKVYFDATVTAEQQALITQGLERWTLALGSGVSYTLVSSEAEASIVIKAGTVTAGAAETVTTGIDAGPPMPLVKAVVTFDFAQIPALDSNTNRTLLVALASHELGHALGINGGEVQGHSSESSDTMYPLVSVNTIGITPRDMNTIQNIYSGLFSGRHHPTTRVVSSGATVTRTVPCHVHLSR